MGSPRKYPAELKERGARMVLAWRQSRGRVDGGIKEVAEQLAVHPESVRNWLKQMHVDAGIRAGLTTEDKARIAELERELRELRRANEILKAAAGSRSEMPNLAAVALDRMNAIVARLPDVERSENLAGCYFLVRRKIFAQLATFVDPRGQPVTHLAWRPDPAEREALLAIGHPYFSGRFHDRVGRIAVLIEETTDWDEIAEFVTGSYRLAAPRKLTAQLDAEDAPRGRVCRSSC